MRVKHFVRGLVLSGVMLALGGCQKQASKSQASTSSELPQAQVKSDPDLQRNFYEIFVGSFYDSNEDGIGDLAGITEKLDYLNTGDPDSEQDLKVNGLWLTPIMPSPSYHKYDVTDYYDIDPAFGNLEDFETLVTEAKQRGIAVIMDLVINHTASDHPWFKKALASFEADATAGEQTYREYYVFKETNESGYTPVPGHEEWAYESRFWSGMPDLNLDNPAVKEELAKIIAFWLEKGIAGFRLDATSHYFEGDTAKNIEFLNWLEETVKGQKADAYLVAEAWEEEQVITEMYASEIDSLFNFRFSQADRIGDITEAVQFGNGRSLGEAVVEYNEAVKKENPHALDAVFLSNHDNGRSAEVLETPAERKMAASTYLLLPGNPFIYYGEEIGLTGVGIDEDKRLPMLFTEDGKGQPAPPENATQESKTDGGSVEAQLQAKDSLLAWYQAVLRIKNDFPVIGRGQVTATEAEDHSSLCVLTYHYDQKTATVIHNFDQEDTVTWQLPKELATKKLQAVLSIGGEEAKLTGGQLVIPPFTTVILAE